MNELTVHNIKNQIVNLPNRPPAMLANNIAEVYGVETRRVNEAVKRNPDRFPDDFCFRLTENEAGILKSQNATSSLKHGGARHLPWMFTRYGANMLSAVLKSPVASQRAIQIMRAFSALEEAAQEAAALQPEAPSPSAGMMTISKDHYINLQQRYINLQQDKIKLLELQYVKKPRRKNRPLTEEVKKEIIRLKLKGLSQSQIAKQVDRSTATVSFVLNLVEG